MTVSPSTMCDLCRDFGQRFGGSASACPPGHCQAWHHDYSITYAPPSQCTAGRAGAMMRAVVMMVHSLDCRELWSAAKSAIVT